METGIKNDTFKIRIKKIGNESSWSNMNTSDLIEFISFNDNKLNGTFSFSVNGESASTNGTGYTKMIPEGNNTNLGRAKVVAHVNSDFGEYDLEFILESYADFVITRIKNFVPS
jgi:hypothetical protein